VKIGRILIIVMLCLIVIGGAFSVGSAVSFFALSSNEDELYFLNKGNVALISIEGEIFTSEKIIEELRLAKRDPSIKAVLLRLNSPGGAVGPSQEILEAVKDVKTVKPVLASMAAIAASGAYYIACGATKIIANPGTITGSIGVIMTHFEVGNLLKWAKVSQETIKSGEYKNLFPLDRKLNVKERKFLQSIILEIYEQFKNDVAELRHLDPNFVASVADGRIFTGVKAKELGLIDEIGGYSKATEMIKEMAGIKGEVQFKEKKERQSFFRSFVEEAKLATKEASSVFGSDVYIPMFQSF